VPPATALREFLDSRLNYRSTLADAFLPHLLRPAPGEVAAVVHYGSCLAGNASADSEPDFYLVVDRLSSWRRGARDLLLHAVLPPTIYHPSFPVDGRARRCKLCLVSIQQLERETSSGAADLYQMGRLSKRIGLLYARDAAARRLVLHAQLRSVELLTSLVLVLLGPRFDVEEFAITYLGLSYLTEPRVHEPGRAQALLRTDRSGYLELSRLALGARAEQTGWPVLDGDIYHAPPPSAEARADLARWIERSRWRARLRWPKHLLTFDGWLEYVVAKLQRHTGAPPELSARQRRLPLLFGWSYLLRLQRNGLVG
jgi:hypothetical protein